MNTITILWLRQLKKYFRSRSRLIGSIGQPLLFLIALGFGFGPTFQAAGEGNYMNFLAPGIIAMSILFTAMFSGIEIIWDRQFGFLKETLVAPVSRYEIMIGRTLGGATIALCQGTIVFFIAMLVGFTPNLVMLPFAFVFALLISLFFTAFGTAIASALDDMQGFQLIMNFLIMPIFFLSGALFPLKDLPEVIYYITLIDPLTYGVDGLRGTLGAVTQFGLLTDFTVLGIATVITLAVGSYLFSRIQV
ncbi:ABC-2 type transporter [Candidatus Bilamarchaeum dharawalense]|uniref:ABC-2 type transporter n=1 Tax=Candidatus Bilamarchaeum dharawalense TaxID=2885759 RepID=A0A5E4LVM2_9ARCH|nr:ABC-2 type transporter [Candidatus Bilamarchaeum dharawalense]